MGHPLQIHCTGASIVEILSIPVSLFPPQYPYPNLQKSLQYTNCRFQSIAACLLPLQIGVLTGNAGRLSAMVGLDVNVLATICFPFSIFSKKGQTSLDL
jgi:hypothetical protein